MERIVISILKPCLSSLKRRFTFLNEGLHVFAHDQIAPASRVYLTVASPSFLLCSLMLHKGEIFGRRPRLTSIGFLKAGSRGAAPGGVSGAGKPGGLVFP